MIKTAIMGYGVVGSGVYEIMRENKKHIARNLGEELDIKYILDIRDFSDHGEKELFVKDADIIANDPEVKIVAETMGGVTFAYEYTKKMLSAGKSVVTSNKELVASKGVELFKIAKEHDAMYLYEASVGGGIPIIRPFVNCLAANRISSVAGILNGTTNYILTKMFKEKSSFEKALSEAQELGYAEKDPSSDVEGHDTARKIAILMALAFGSAISEKDIETEGITNITGEDVCCAGNMGYTVKLIGYGFIQDEKVFARVCPMLINYKHPLAAVEDVFNAAMIKGDMVGDVMMYGKGAGKSATASAVVADMMDAARHKCRFDARFTWGEEKEGTFIDPQLTKSAFFVRCEKSMSDVKAVFGNVSFSDSGNAFITEEMTEAEFSDKSARLGGIISKIRLYK